MRKLPWISRLLAWPTLVVVCSLFPSHGHAQYWLYTMRPGDNLWDVSERYLVSMDYWRALQRLNNVTQPREMPPGSTLRVPIRWLRLQPASVLVVDVKGEVLWTDGLSGQTAPLVADLELNAADEIRTGADASVTLQFADGTRFLVQANSRLVLDQVSAYGRTGMVDTRMRLHQGRLDARTAPSKGPGTRFEVWTPAAVSAVRGTQYRVAMEPEREVALTEVLEGGVEVTGAGRTRRVPQGFGSVAEVGRPPAPPVPLLDPPALGDIPDVLDRVPVQFEVPPLPGAVAYRLQIAPDAAFDSLLFDRVHPRPQLVGPDLPDGDYVLRLRAIDASGLEGRDATRPVEIDARPEPPVLLTPDDDATVREPVPEFRWTEPQEARGFHLQLATDPDFAAPIVDLADHQETSFVPAGALTPGRYYWHVATTDSGGETGPFSDAQSFLLRPAPESPEVEDPAVTDDTLVFRWRAGMSGQRYQVQIATERRFDNIVVEATVDEPRLEVARLPPGRYHLRVRTIDVDGFAGPYGTPQKFDVPPTNYWSLLIIPIVLLALLL